MAPPPFQVQEVAVHLAMDTEGLSDWCDRGAVAIPSMHRAGFFSRVLSFQTGKNQNRLGLRFIAGLEIDGYPGVFYIPSFTNGDAYTRPRRCHEQKLYSPLPIKCHASLFTVIHHHLSIHQHYLSLELQPLGVLMEFRSLARLSTRKLQHAFLLSSLLLGRWIILAYHTSNFFLILSNPLLTLSCLSKVIGFCQMGAFFIPPLGVPPSFDMYGPSIY